MESHGFVGGCSSPNVAQIAIEQRRKRPDVVEPEIISEDLLRDGIEEPAMPDGEMWDINTFRHLSPTVTSLRLSFLNIIEISNLNNFDALTTLRLDNNIIEKIQNLSHLHNLTWLDLSFNNIKEIQELDELHNLTDLSLYHNKIEVVKGLDGCQKLNILSLGHNQITDLKQINYLRKFKNLRCVCLEGNAVCKLDSYKPHVLAYLTKLKYLDYMLVDQKAVVQARESYQDELSERRAEENEEKQKKKQQKEREATLTRLKAAFIDWTEDLVSELFADEPEVLTSLQSYNQLQADWEGKITEHIKYFREFMESKNELRLKKIAAFEKAVANSEKDSEEEAFQHVRDFRRLKKKSLSTT